MIVKDLPIFKDRTLNFINPSDIDFGARARENYGDMAEIVADVKERGIITPITVVAKEPLSAEELDTLEASDPEKPYLLLAGGRRTKASLEVGLEKMPAQIYYHVLSELELRITELHENIIRKNFDFREEVDAKARIHELLVGRYGEKMSTAIDAPGVSLRDTAAIIGVSPAVMSQDVRLSKAMRENPDIAKASTKTEALKMYDQMVKKEAMAMLAERQKRKKVVSDEAAERKLIVQSYMIGNFFEGVKKVKDKTVNLVEIDPPYAIDLTNVKKDGQTDDYNEIDPAFYEGFMREAFNEAYRCLTDHGWLLCWFGPDPWFNDIYQWIVEAGKPEGMEVEDWTRSNRGFKLRRMPAVWTKRSGQTQQPAYNLANATEYFFYARKGDPGINRQGRINVFEYAPVSSKLKDHPTERPIEMMEDIYTTFTRENATIMIPFLGSGNGILAAANRNMTAFGWDLSKAYQDSFSVEAMTGPFRKWRSY
jgi:site-specific DNA-methyltransferase (adenine-specific)